MLVVNGTLSAIDGLAIAENTMLTGTGVIDGDVSNQGTVNPGTSGPGSLVINGDYTQDQSGKLVIEVTSPDLADDGRVMAKDFDQLIVFNTGGFLAGGDYSWNESFITGVFGGYEGTGANYANSGRTKSNAFRFGTYASYSTGGFYSNAIIGAAFACYNVDRPIEWTGFERDAGSKTTSGEFFSLLALGYDWTLGNFTFGPSVSAQIHLPRYRLGHRIRCRNTAPCSSGC